MDLFLPAHCSVGIYDVGSKEKHVECATTRSKYAFFISLTILVIIILLFYATSGSLMFFVLALCFALMTVGAAIGWALSGPLASREYDVYQYNVDQLVKSSGMSPADANKTLRADNYERNRNEAIRYTAMTQSQPQNNAGRLSSNNSLGFLNMFK